MAASSYVTALARVAALALAVGTAAAAPTTSIAGAAGTGAATPPPGVGVSVAASAGPARPIAPPTGCLTSGDGYLRARIGGAIDATIDWPNSGTRCQGETKGVPPGVRLSFQRAAAGKPNWLFVFGLTGIREGLPAHATGVNLTVILQGTSRIFGTLGDSRCTIDSLSQKPLPTPGSYRVEARGFCTQPAHAVRGDGDLLVSTFEFAGPVNYADATTPVSTPAK